MRRGSHRVPFGAGPGEPPTAPRDPENQIGRALSAETAGPETLGSLTDEPELDPNSEKAKEISGKSPLRIALGRLSRDKIAVVCAFVVLFFVFCAVFAGPICALFGVSLETPLASERVDGLNNGLPKPEYGPPNGSFTWDHPMGVAPRTGEDNLAYWLYGCRVSLTIATTATVVEPDNAPRRQQPKKQSREQRRKNRPQQGQQQRSQQRPPHSRPDPGESTGSSGTG